MVGTPAALPHDVGQTLARPHPCPPHRQSKLDAMVAGSGSEDASALRVAMQQIMTAKVGIFAPVPTWPLR